MQVQCEKMLINYFYVMDFNSVEVDSFQQLDNGPHKTEK